MQYPTGSTYRLVVKPEGHPRDHDDHERGDVDGDDVVGQLPFERHVHSQATVVPYNTISVFELQC